MTLLVILAAIAVAAVIVGVAALAWRRYFSDMD